MRPHILDRPKSMSDRAVMEAFGRQPAQKKPHRSTLALQRRTKPVTEGARLREYLRIDRSGDV